MQERPTIVPEAVAEMMDAAPTRIRKRLDRDPGSAKQWEWSWQDGHWEVSTGNETVSLAVDEQGQLGSSSDASCTCLLSPKCFHVLACVTSLSLAKQNPEEQPRVEQPSLEPEGEVGMKAVDWVEVSQPMISSARQTIDAVEAMLMSGARASGVVIQSTLLRAAHQCRVEGMVHLANATIGLLEGIQRLRTADDHTNTEQIRKDAVAAITRACRITRGESIRREELGGARRPYVPVSLSWLRGILAEPILTLSGYAGVCVHLEGDDGSLYQVAELQPGGAPLVHQAYQGGIDLGATTVSARELSRGWIDVQNLTASSDGRLGKGTQTRWVMRNEKDTSKEGLGRFGKPISQQIADVFANQTSDEPTLRSGWDLVACEGTVIGPMGAVVLLDIDGMTEPMKLGITIDNDQLEYRRNLQMIARCPGLRLRVGGRVQIDIAGRINPLCIEPVSIRLGDSKEDDKNGGSPPQLTLPDSYQGRCHLGLDPLHRHYFNQADRFATEAVMEHEIVLDQEPRTGTPAFESDLFPGLTRRLTALVVGGRSAIASIGPPTHRRDRQRLLQRSQTSAAQLLDAIASAVSTSATRSSGSPATTKLAITVAAADLYCQRATASHQFDRWKTLLESTEE